MWFSSKDLVGIANLPTNPSNITRLASRKGWEKRQIKGVKGVAYEYALSSLPEEVQAEIRRKQALEIVSKKPAVQVERDLDLRSLTDWQ